MTQYSALQFGFCCSSCTRPSYFPLCCAWCFFAAVLLVAAFGRATLLHVVVDDFESMYRVLAAYSIG